MAEEIKSEHQIQRGGFASCKKRQKGIACGSTAAAAKLDGLLQGHASKANDYPAIWDREDMLPK